MVSISNIPLYVAPPAPAEIGSAYLRLALGVSQQTPGLLNIYLGPPEWLEVVQADPPSWEMLRQHAIAVATAAQKSDLPRHRRERILRNVRALLWLIRAKEGEKIMFSEQVRLLLDLQPESATEEVFQAAHETLATLLPGSDSLAERWARWQAKYAIPARAGLPLLAAALNTLRERLGHITALIGDTIQLIETGGTGSLAYQRGQLQIPQGATFRVDRLYHGAARWGYGGLHTIHSAMIRRYAAGQGEVEGAVLLNLGPDQVIVQGLPLALLPELELYSDAIPALLATVDLPAIDPASLQAIHLAEDALQWTLANAALLLHGEGLRPRVIRRYLMANGLFSPETADKLLTELISPGYAAHVFAPLIGGPLLKAWLAQENHSVSDLLLDPPAPSTMAFEVRFAD